MPSRFPGMDPYLEDPAFWQDFHRSFITYCRDYLLDRLPDSYEARIDEQVRLVERADESRAALPDVSIHHDPAAVPAPRHASPAGSVATLEPVTIPMPLLEEVRDTWIEIRHRPERSLVTLIELLSPWNKTGDGWSEYRAKRRAIYRQPVHLVEIDLLLGGRRSELRYPLPTGDYFVLVARAEAKPDVEVYYWGLRDPLPTVPVPLRSPDPDLPLELAPIFSLTYERGRYARALRYAQPPAAPMSAEDRTWAAQLALNSHS